MYTRVSTQVTADPHWAGWTMWGRNLSSIGGRTQKTNVIKEYQNDRGKVRENLNFSSPKWFRNLVISLKLPTTMQIENAETNFLKLTFIPFGNSWKPTELLPISLNLHKQILRNGKVNRLISFGSTANFATNTCFRITENLIRITSHLQWFRWIHRQIPFCRLIPCMIRNWQLWKRCKKVGENQDPFVMTPSTHLSSNNRK